MRRIKKVFKWLLYAVVVLLLLFLLAWLLLKTEYVQNKLLPRVTKIASNTLGAEVQAGHISIDFFSSLVLKDTRIIDEAGHPIIDAGTIDIDISLFSFFDKQLSIDNIRIADGIIDLHEESGAMNYQFIIDHLTSKPKSNNDTVSESWAFDIDNISLENVIFSMENEQQNIQSKWSSVAISIDKFDLENNRYHIGSTRIDGAEVKIFSKLASENSEPVAFPILPLELSMDEFTIENSSFSMGDVNSNQDNSIQFGDIKIKANGIVAGEKYAASVSEASFIEKSGVHLNKLSGDFQFSERSLEIKNFDLATDKSDISLDGTASYENLGALVANPLGNPFSFDVENVSISRAEVSRFVDLDAIEQVNFQGINQLLFSGKVSNDGQVLRAKEIEMNVGRKLDLSGSFMANHIDGEVKVYTANIRKISTNQDNLFQILPSLKLPEQIKNLGAINGSVIIKGDKERLEIIDSKLDFGGNNHFYGNGLISFASETTPLKMNMEIKDAQLNPEYIFEKQNDIPEQVFLLGNTVFNGRFNGTLEDFVASGRLDSELGGAALDMHMQFYDDYSNAKYKGHVDLQSFDLNTLLQDTIYGTATLSANLDGRGITIDDINTKIDADLMSFTYDGYEYNNARVNGTIQSDGYVGELSINDKNIAADVTGEVHYVNGEVSLIIDGTIDTIDLKALNLSDSLYAFSGYVKGNLKGGSINSMAGDMWIDDFQMSTSHGTFSDRDTIFFNAASSQDGEKEYIFTSSFLEVVMQGDIDVESMDDLVRAYIQEHIPVDVEYENSTHRDSTRTPQKFSLDVKTLDINPLLNALLPYNAQIKKFSLQSQYDEATSLLSVQGVMDSLYIGNVLIPDGYISVNGDSDTIFSNVTLLEVTRGGNEIIPLLSLDSKLSEKVAGLDLTLTDNAGDPRLKMSGDLSRTDEYVFNFHESLLLNKQEWKFSPYNTIYYGEDGFFFEDVKVSKGDQAITVYSDSNDNGEALEVLFDRFEVSELSKIIGKENEFFFGEINGAVVVNSLYDKPFLTSDLDVEDITLEQENIGNLEFEAIQNTDNNTVEISAILLGENNDVVSNVVYDITTESLKGDAHFKKFYLKSIDPFMADITKDSEGYASGKVKVSGTPYQPILEGKLHLSDVETTPIFTNSRNKIEKGTITIEEGKFDLGTLIIQDKDGNEATVTGEVRHNSLQNMYLDLELTTEKFLFLNTTEKENEIYYGNLPVKASVQVDGYLDDITIDGVATVLDNSSLAISPLVEIEQSTTYDYIIFDDPRKIKKDSSNFNIVLEDPFPFNVDLKISVDESAELQFVVNPVTGDKLVCRGRSDMIFKMKPSGEMELYGTYDITEGTYSFSYGLISKKFDLIPGGTVTFNGDPLDGVLDVEAEYETYTTLYELISKESNLSEVQTKDAQRKSEVVVLLSLDGVILKPEISLDLQAKDIETTSLKDVVDSKFSALRNNPDEMNNQVFGLLIFDSFILSDNSGEGLAGTGQNIAFSSLSSLVTNQLNKLASNLIKGVDVNFDVNSYRNQYLDEGDGGLVTEFGVDFSKQLFNDRLTITAGTNINLESSSSESEFNTVAGDFVIEYKLTESGSYRVKVFSKSNYDRLIDENASRNGVSFSARKNFGEIKRKKKEN